ncbi:fibronectin type III domain-containing protein [Saprospiraceae bacterium]|nr:fibronectin type III domain-containing protein [Saprospiraceae bacterium]
MKKFLIISHLVLFLVIIFSSCSDDLELQENTNDQSDLIEQVHDHRNCGNADHMQELLSNPEYKKSYDQRVQKFKAFNAANPELKMNCTSPDILPVAIHYQGVNNPNLSCLTGLAEDAIQVLNDDFQGSNSDITLWTNGSASSFPGISNGEACVQFVIADQNHPSGYGLTNGDPAITVNATSGDTDSNWSGYINIFVQPNTGYLGYSPLGGAGNGDGVVIDASAWGAGGSCSNVGSSAPFNLGRTLTHEVGHYLFLDHIWGNGCNSDDGVSDTPSQNSDYSGCPNVGASSCGSTDMHMNYMDYSNDACMYMFSAGQATVTTNYVNSSLGNVTGNASSVISGTTGGGGGGGNTTCDAPTSSSISGLTATTATISFSAAAQANSYLVQQRVSGTTSWTHNTVTQTQLDLTNLIPATTYQYRIRTACSSGNSSFTTVATFTTSTNNNGGGTCDKPGFTEVENINNTKTKVSWEAMPDAIRYNIRYRIVGGSWVSRNTTQTQRTLSNLTAGATYQYRVRTKCASGWTGFTTTETFVQGGGGSGGGNNGCNDNALTFELTLDNYGSETTWELIKESNNQVVTEGGPYNDNQSGTKKTTAFCIPDGCYTLYVDDSYGDGICCSYGNGSFELKDSNGTTVGYSDGNFGYYDYIEFCVSNNVVTFRDQQKDVQSTNLAKKGSFSGSNN